jgi:RHS repeat-associated protein
MATRLPIALLTLFISLFAAAAFAAEGRTPGQFVLSPTGGAQYTIPIWAPPGPRGMQPNILLVYDSQTGIGPLGIGWSLSGLGAIIRCNLTAAQDTTPAPVALVTGDGYCINGNRLRLTSGTYGTAGSVYQTEIADFSQITAVGTAGNGPASFTVQARNGLTYYYGFTDTNGNGANSEVLANGSTTALSWLLSKVVDRAGNNYVINYTTLTGTAVPNDILWTLASAGASTYTYKMLFNYTTNVPQSSINEYVAGTLVNNTDLLSSIEIFVGTTVVKDYFLGYQASPVTGREELISVKECADSGGASCLLPTSVTYQGGSPGVSTTSHSTGISSDVELTTRYDLNGDGYPDIVYAGTTTMYVAFGSASGYGTPINTGAPVGYALVGRLTGGTQDAILANNGGTWWSYTWNGSSFVAASTGIPFDTNSTGYELADINGDGLPDLIELSSVYSSFTKQYTETIYSRLNTSSSSTVSFGSTNTSYTTLVTVSAQLLTPDMQYGKLRRYDFNGDGRDDLVLKTITGTSPNYVLNTYELVSTGTAFTANLIATAANGSYVPVYFTNWNDDKCTDFVSSNVLYVSGCNGTAAQTYSMPGTVLLAFDWDGDGRDDILVANGSTIGVYVSKATGAPTLTTTTFPYSASCLYVWMDANADGLDDLGCSGSSYYLHNGAPDLASEFTDGYGNSASLTYVSISDSNYTAFPSSSLQPTFPDIVYIGPLFVVSEVVFSDPSSTSSTYNQTFHYYAAWTNLQGRGFEGFQTIYTADSRTTGPPALTRYQYFEQQFPWTWMKYTDLITTPVFYPTETVGTPNTLAVATLSSTTNQERFFPYFTNVTTTQKEVGGSENGDAITTTSTNYTYDAYGNATNIVTTVTDNDPNSPYTGDTWTTNTTNTTDISVNQSTDLAAWCLNMLDETQAVYSSTLSGSTSVTRTKTLTPDTAAECRIKTLVTEPTANSGLYKVTEALTFDSFGNVATDTITGANMPSSPASRLTTLNWGTTGQFLNSRTDPSSATTTWTYSSNQSLTFGVPDSVSNPNNLTTSWTYDAFGRKAKETRPDGTSTTWTWSACTSSCGWSNSVYQIAQTAYQTNGTTAIRTDTTSYDPVDRATQTAGPTVTGATATAQKLYNSLGLVVQQSMPFLTGGTAYQQSFGYDVLNRLVESERPVSASSGQTYCNPATVPPVSGCQGTSYVYAGRKLAITDALGNSKTTITDVNGWLRRTTDALGFYVTKAYDSAGSLVGVTDSVGNSLLKNVTVVYGIKPFITAATDADRGAWTFTVDSLGERTGWTDAKGQTFAKTYDALSRALTRTEPDLFTQWTWGSTPASYNVGQLISECTGTGTTCVASTGYSESRTFDSYGRLSTRAITQGGNPGNDPGGVFLFTWGYSTQDGRLSTLTYPTSTSSVAFNLAYTYQYGLLHTVVDETDTTTICGTTCTLWTANATNAFGQVTQETLGNGVVTNRTYDAVNSWLSAATGGVGGGATLLNQSYLEDKNGNIIQRQNNNLGLTESFAYDGDNRLTCTALSSTCTTSTLAYDGGVAGPGNITSQTGVGTYTYPAAGQPQPHAVTSLTGTFNGIVNPTFSYDANGNMTSRAGSTVSWFSNNYPATISASDATGSEEVQFNYGPDRQRWKQTYTLASSTETTYYIGGLVDLVFNGIINFRHYIYAGSEPIAVYIRTNSIPTTMNYTIEDHQGGVSAITSSAGATDVDESFSSFGTRRNPTTWSGAPTTTDLNTIASLSRQGYTFQTWLGQSMGLNHMNGRVEDAILGRFLSPDPHIPDPTNAQSYNRYSYVNNNPLTNTDPSGFCPAQFLLTAGSQSGCGGNPDAAMLAGAGAMAGASDGFDALANIGSTAALSAWYAAATGILNTADAQSNVILTSNDSSENASPHSNLSAQSQDPTQSLNPSAGIPDSSTGALPNPSGVNPSTTLSEITVTGVVPNTGDSNSSYDPSDFSDPSQLGEIIVVGNKGERGWQGNNPNPAKGVQPIRDSNGKITGWSVRDPQTGKRTGKSLEWGRQNGLDPNNFFSPDGPLPSIPPLFGVPGLNPWWWFFFSAPAN